MAGALRSASLFIFVALVLIAFRHFQIEKSTIQDLQLKLTHTQATVIDDTTIEKKGTQNNALRVEKKTSSFARENEKRIVHLKKTCEDKTKAFRVQKLSRVYIQPYFSVCVSPKAGSTSWKALGKIYSVPPPSATTDIKLKKVLCVRNPFTRLTSAYRDKYLNGNPISMYNAEWIARTQSITQWITRWYAYWLPALVSRGDIKPPLYIIERHTIPRKPENPCENLFSPTAHAQFRRPFKTGNDYHTIFRNATFTFADFLHHILWTWDMGLVNKHWAPQSCHCPPCGQGYDYILHMENVSLEAREVFAEVGLEGAENDQKHSTKAALDVTDKGYFETIDKETMERIMELYKYDFEFFGYSKSF